MFRSDNHGFLASYILFGNTSMRSAKSQQGLFSLAALAIMQLFRLSGRNMFNSGHRNIWKVLSLVWGTSLCDPCECVFAVVALEKALDAICFIARHVTSYLSFGNRV